LVIFIPDSGTIQQLYRKKFTKAKKDFEETVEWPVTIQK
jgi:hypothetical protein